MGMMQNLFLGTVRKKQPCDLEDAEIYNIQFPEGHDRSPGSSVDSSRAPEIIIA